MIQKVIRQHYNKTFGHSSYGSYYIIDKEKYSKVVSIVNNKSVTTIEEGSKVYFAKHVKFSRMRFRDWANRHNVSIVRSPERANYLVIDPDQINPYSSSITVETLNWGCNGEGDLSIFPYFSHHSSHSLGGGFVMPCIHLYHDYETDLMEELGKLYDRSDLSEVKFITVENLSKLTMEADFNEDNYREIDSMLSSTDNNIKELCIDLLGGFQPDITNYWYTKLIFKHVSNILSLNSAKSAAFYHVRNGFISKYNRYMHHSGYLGSNSEEESIRTTINAICSELRGVPQVGELPQSLEVIPEKELLSYMENSVNSNIRRIELGPRDLTLFRIKEIKLEYDTTDGKGEYILNYKG